MSAYRKSTILELTNSRELLQNPYAHINDIGKFDAVTKNSKYNRLLIQQQASNLQKTIWVNRKKIWQNNIPTDPIDLLDPKIAIEYLGYNFETNEYLGEFYSYGKNFEVAGILNRAEKRVRLSNRLIKSNDTLRFTAAHELGHILLHNEIVMHRDRPLNGSQNKFARRDPIEIEADFFASLFLMPKKLVENRFYQIFGVNKFILTDDTAFSLSPKSTTEIIKKCKNQHDLARVLAKTTHYNGQQINSLSAQFKVSIEAMAIRIKELNLI